VSAPPESPKPGSPARANWAAVLSHEARTPLATVIAATRELVERWGSLDLAQRNTLVEIIAQESERLAVLVSWELDVGFSQGPRCEVDLAELVRSTLAASALAHPKAVFSLAEPVVEATISGDAVALRQLVANLLDNAVLHADPGGTIEVSVVVEPARFGVAVSDEGPGIDLAHQQRIFARGVRGVGAEPSTGRGLGLWISRSIAEAHGGVLDLDSSPGDGSTFTLWLPRRNG